MKIIGILGFQGAFFEHKKILDQLKVYNIIVKTTNDIKKIDALIIPGGESTVISKFIIKQNLLNELKNFILEKKRPVMGTCAGAILLSTSILDKNELKQGLIPAINLVTERNSYGSQINSFIKNIKLDNILLCTFHPELEDTKIHEYFISNF